MTILPLSPYTCEALGRDYAAATTEGRRALWQEWQQRYGDDLAYELFLTGLSFIAYPEDPQEFRRLHAAANVTDADQREAVSRLDDEALTNLAASLRGMYLKAVPSGVTEVWTLAKQMAGVA